MQVPFLDLHRQHEPLDAALREAFARVLASGNYIGGPEVERFEATAAAVAGCSFAVGVSSGTDALLAALIAPRRRSDMPVLHVLCHRGIYRTRRSQSGFCGLLPPIVQS
jgi:dTDP-4-amino-4,6-dideoxygalactose transaminase